MAESDGGGRIDRPAVPTSARRYEVTRERRYRAPRPLVWGLVADTNRWDRSSGLTPGRYEWRDHGGQRVRAATAREMGFDIEWVEPPYEWVEGQFVHGARRFLKGPVAGGGFRAVIDDGPDGTTIVAATAYVAGDSAWMHVLGPVMTRRFRLALEKYLDGLAAVVAELGDAPPGRAPALIARDALAGAAYDPVTQGARSPVDHGELDRRASRLDGVNLRSEIAAHLVESLRERPDEEVAQMRPFELADRWKTDRRETLRVFLHATLSGLVELRWQINCPVCRVAARVVGTLADLSGSVHCAACNIDYGVAFDQHIEAVFQCHPAIREVETSVFCASSPSFLPHVVAQIEVPPRGRRSARLDLPAGSFHVRTLSGPQRADTVVGASCGLSIGVSENALMARPMECPAGAERTLELVSELSEPVVVLVERTGATSDAVLGSVVATYPEFLNLFATEAPASGVELTIGTLALLFSDLTGSTALYQRVGDARAFGVVQEHFSSMSAAVTEHDGAIVKTMGDAVMATFTTELDAIAAAVDMLRRCQSQHGSLGLSAKLGVHAGPCLAVRANDRLDFFGTTVNVAARLQAQARGGELVLDEELARRPEVAALLDGLPRRVFSAALRGLEGDRRLVAFRAVETTSTE